MKSVGLSIFGISIRDSENEEKRVDLKKFGEGTFLEEIGKLAMVNLQKYQDDKSKETLFAFEEILFKDHHDENKRVLNKVLFGKVTTGEYGEDTQIVDVKTGKKKYKKTPNDADMRPFGFAIVVPEDPEVYFAFIVMQSLGRYGIKTVIEKKLNLFVKSINSDYRLKLSAIMPKIIMERLLKKGVLKKIKMTQWELASDRAEMYGVNRGVKEERILYNPEGFLVKKGAALKECILGKKRYSEIMEVDGFEIDQMKLEFTLGGRNKTVNLSNIDDLSIVQDITKEVKKDGENPEFKSLCKLMLELCIEYVDAREGVI